MVAPCGSAIPGRRRVSTSTEKSIADSSRISPLVRVAESAHERAPSTCLAN